MKLLGILLGGLALFLAGNSLAVRLKEEAGLLRKGQLLILRVRRALTVRKLPTGQILRELAADADFACFPFVRKTADRFTGTESPALIWQEEVDRWKGLPHSPAGREALRELGGILGGSDGESQAAALLLLEERMQGSLSQAEKRAAADGKLCRSLGVLAGLMLAVLAI